MPCGRLPGYMWHTTCTRGAKLACMWLGHNFTLSSKWKLLIDALSRFDQVTGLHQLCWRHGLWSERSDLSTASMFTRLLLPQLCNDHHPHPRCSASLARGFRVLDKFVCDLTWVWYNMSITRIRMAYTLSLMHMYASTQEVQWIFSTLADTAVHKEIRIKVTKIQCFWTLSPSSFPIFLKARDIL